MPSLTIRGVTIAFPFAPYECQKDFMAAVLQALQTNQNALLESPTGTGKTLCLLCSSLAWLETKKAELQLRAHMAAANSGAGDIEHQLRTGAGPDTDQGLSLAPPRIIYASRTHTQLSQVMSELKRTMYAGFRTAVIASRDQLCIHPTVSKETSNQAKLTACRIKVASRTCHFYNNVEKKKDAVHMNNPDDPASNILDIEDLKKLGQKHKCCPYYLTRNAAKESADIIFMPYNYLLDPVIRKRHGIELEGNIVIFDEAHNLNQVCEESASVDLSSSDIAAAIAETDEVLNMTLNLVENGSNLENLTNQTEETINFDLLTPENVAKLKGVLLNLENEIDCLTLTSSSELRKDGAFLFEMLAKVQLTFNTYTPLYAIVDAAVAYLTGGGYTGIHAKAYGLNKFATFLKVVFESDTYNRDKAMEFRQTSLSQYYKVYVRDEDVQSKKSNKGSWGAKNEVKVRTLSYWCFSPGFSMIDLQKQGVRCILLTSGTLKPLPSFSSELRIPFPVTLENPHVIDSGQVMVAVAKQGPEEVVLNSNFQNRSNPRYHTSLGYAVLQIAKAVPNGLLIFFPAYHIMKSIIDSWRNSHIMQCIERYKPIYVEPTDKEEFQQAMEQYYASINDATANGAIFAGVCRGKVSEGLDFVDKNGRAVIITGIPYAPAKDPRVIMKKEFLDEQMKKFPQAALSGHQWYQQQASRAVNQAIGRVIRHRFDYGAILLLDVRFAEPRSKEELPSWVRKELVVHETFSSLIRALNQFFKTVPALVDSTKVAAGFNPVDSEAQGKPKIQIVFHDGAVATPELGVSVGKMYRNGNPRQVSVGETSGEQTDEAAALADGRLTNVKAVRRKIKIIKQQLRADEPSSCAAGKALPDCQAPDTETDSSLSSTTPSLSTRKQHTFHEAVAILGSCKTQLSADEYLLIKKGLIAYKHNQRVSELFRVLRQIDTSPDTRKLILQFRDIVKESDRAAFDSLCLEAYHITYADLILQKLAESGKPLELRLKDRLPSQAGSENAREETLSQASSQVTCRPATLGSKEPAGKAELVLQLFSTFKREFDEDKFGKLKVILQNYKQHQNVAEMFGSLLKLLGHKVEDVKQFECVVPEHSIQQFRALCEETLSKVSLLESSEESNSSSKRSADFSSADISKKSKIS